jgi:hypothetical protein
LKLPAAAVMETLKFYSREQGTGNRSKNRCFQYQYLLLFDFCRRSINS